MCLMIKIVVPADAQTRVRVSMRTSLQMHIIICVYTFVAYARLHACLHARVFVANVLLPGGFSGTMSHRHAVFCSRELKAAATERRNASHPTVSVVMLISDVFEVDATQESAGDSLDT